MRRTIGTRAIYSVCLLFLLLLLLAACGEPVATPEPVFLQAAGSTAMEPLVAELAAAFSEQSPLVSVEVAGWGTHFGLEALRAGEVDFALVSWLPPDFSEADDWRTMAIARDGLAIIVHPANPVEGLGLLQLQDLFGGRAYDWEAVGGRTGQGAIQPVSREGGSGARAAFEALVMTDLPVTPSAVVAPSGQAVVEYVAENPAAIGYVSMGLVALGVKVLKIEGEWPTPESVGQGSYPLNREMWLVTAAAPSDAVQDFVDFALSPAGQQIVGRRYGRVR